MKSSPFAARRRMLLGAAGLGASASPLATLAQAFLPTPRQAEGPFYPLRLPGDQDNDLVSVKGVQGTAKGEITHLSGRILNANGRPLRGVRVEIWQCDANGRYHHPGDRSGADADPNFQGFGHYVTGAEGGYTFRTIKPVPYPGRAPHIHFKLRSRDYSEFVTQMYVAGHPQNDRDALLASISDGRRRASLLAYFRPPSHKSRAGCGKQRGELLAARSQVSAHQSARRRDGIHCPIRHRAGGDTRAGLKQRCAVMRRFSDSAAVRP